MALGLGLGLQFNRGVGGGFDSDYQAVLDYATVQGYTLPSAGHQSAGNNLMAALNNGGLFAKLDSFSVRATDGNSDFALIDWKRLTTATAVNSPTFTINQGFNSNDISSYINSGYKPSTDGVNFTQNSASVFAYVFASGVSVNAYMIGNLNIRLRNLNTSNQRLNTTVDFAPAPNFSGTGFFHLNRSSANDEQAYKNGILISSTAGASSLTLDNDDMRILSTPSFGGRFSDMIISIDGWGASLTAGEAATLNNAVQNYISAL